MQDQLSSVKRHLKELKSERDSARRELGAVKQQNSELQEQAAQTAASATCGDRHTPFRPSTDRASTDPELAAFLQEVAVNDEVMVAVSNENYAHPGGMLDVWMGNARRAGVKNAMIVALDDATKANVQKFGAGYQAFRMDVEIPESQKDAGSNHAVSALKFRILRRFLVLGYAVLLSDVDIVTLQNPFEHLVRDSDVESMSDGWDAPTAYGYNDVMVRCGFGFSFFFFF